MASHQERTSAPSDHTRYAEARSPNPVSVNWKRNRPGRTNAVANGSSLPKELSSSVTEVVLTSPVSR